jgi:hypothetical protein
MYHIFAWNSIFKWEVYQLATGNEGEPLVGTRSTLCVVSVARL